MALKRTPKPKYLLIDGCPCPYDIAPYIYCVLRKAGQTASSIYRGEDVRALLHAHGKHTQGEIFATSPSGVANPPGKSTHELRSDGRSWPGPIGRQLLPWQVGIDSGQDTVADRNAIEAAAQSYGWRAFHPYSAGVELHHWGFKVQPHAKNRLQRAHLAAIRARLPRR